jgi:catechol 2,3-dioxygenase-like lactoylglutathione lyase family enzyme
MIKLAHVCIESADLDATERYYECLGLRRQFEFRNPAGLLIGYYLKFDDDTFLEVIRVESVRDEGAVRHFAIESDDIERLRQRLLAAGFAASDKRLGGDETVDGHQPGSERRVHRAAPVRRAKHAAARRQSA